MAKTMFSPSEPKKLGMLTPSSNTSLEPICSRMVSGHEDKITMHYSRLMVTKISLEEDALSQFDFDPFLRASEYLAHADVDAIIWNGTSGGWLGFETDKILCEKITKETGIPATTSMLALMEAFDEEGLKSFHMVTPYIPEINERMSKEFLKYGYEAKNFRGLAQTVNRSFSLVTREQIDGMAAEVCVSPADGLVIVCTNLKAAWQIEELEKKYGLTVYDSTAIAVWKGLKMTGLPLNLVTGFGRLFTR
ncbi:aspartate/glutamate racemase family protein [Oscillospiraceae bacterium OttesenSCG-928-G22]|nr:aspartate/glutamate racemase family protein [Oscillospiraceae bacterium OttesenSCG-928-G22]